MSERLKHYWDQPVSELAQVELGDFQPVEMEKHQIFCLLLMAVVHDYWNGNIWGDDGEYPWRRRQLDKGRYIGGRYLGHNLAAIAVDIHGNVLDFDFNHNDLFQSSIEHAESRLVRRLFNLTEIREGWLPNAPSATPISRRTDEYAGLLAEVTIYTSLESCAQCSGIMTLASAKSVVFLQSDPGQYSIGNILHNLAPPRPDSRYHAPKPIPAGVLGLPYFEELDQAYSTFREAVKTLPFHIPGNGAPNDHSPAISSFLCTDDARDIYAKGAIAFDTLTPRDPTNRRVLDAARSFRRYVRVRGCRGTPH